MRATPFRSTRLQPMYTRPWRRICSSYHQVWAATCVDRYPCVFDPRSFEAFGRPDSGSRSRPYPSRRRSRCSAWASWPAPRRADCGSPECDCARVSRKFSRISEQPRSPTSATPRESERARRGFAVERSRMTPPTSCATAGRPVRCRLFQVQNKRTPRRCRRSPRFDSAAAQSAAAGASPALDNPRIRGMN